MKQDWSKILVITMAAFIVFVVAMGIKMANSDQDIYEEDYYEQGELHAERMTLEEVGKHVDVSYNYGTNSLDIKFEGKGFVKEYKMIYLASRLKDFSNKIESSIPVESQSIRFNKALSEGQWMLEIEGAIGGQAFFKKQALVK